MAEMASPSNEAIPITPPPWKLKGTLYIFMLYTTGKDAAKLSSDPDFVYSKLEAESSFSKGEMKGGLSMLQLIRYSESPVGPYDELVLVPGYFEYEVEGKDKNGKTKLEKRKNLKCTKVFVSQEQTCWNGRTNWNIPKHLAHFEFKDLPNGGTSIAVYPLLPDRSGKETIRGAPFITTKFQPISHLPSFPASTNWSKYLGIDLNLVQPPLPKGDRPALAGTKQWCKVPAVESSKKTSLGWFDLRQNLGSDERDSLLGGGDIPGGGKHENFWPGLGRWRVGMKMEDAVIEFPEGEYWDGPRQ